MRTALYIVMILSFFGLGLCDCLARNWRLGVASILLGVVQALIFYK